MKRIIAGICILTLCAGFSGCATKQGGASSPSPAVSSQAENSGTAVTPSPAVSPQTEVSATFDYTPFLKKTWVKINYNDEGISAHDTPISFFITDIENGMFEGDFSIGVAAIPALYYHLTFKSLHWGKCGAT